MIYDFMKRRRIIGVLVWLDPFFQPGNISGNVGHRSISASVIHSCHTETRFPSSPTRLVLTTSTRCNYDFFYIGVIAWHAIIPSIQNFVPSHNHCSTVDHAAGWKLAEF